jgi:hypothetical protein
LRFKSLRTGNFAKKAAFFLAIGSLVVVSAMPASANEESWNLEVNVVDTGCAPSVTAPTWSPISTVTYSQGNEIDLDYQYQASDSWVHFTVNLGFEQGMDNCTSTPVDPYGTVVSSFNDPEGVLTPYYLYCSDSCNALTVWMDGSEIEGVLDASQATTVGTETGTLTVVWTP